MFKYFGIVLASVLPVVVAGCSSSEGSSDKSSSSGDDPDDTSTNADDKSGELTERELRCSNELTANSCQDCCGFTEELAWIMIDAADECACAGECQAKCASTQYCSPNGSDVSAECRDCLPTCSAKGDAVCMADPLCKAYGECTLGAQCEKKQGGLEDPNRR